jgi:rfaE bifunctional protein kinase chain/domain
MLTDITLRRILDRIPSLIVGVVGDVFLDRYLDLDAALTEPSLETGLDAYQVTQVRSSPGAAGTVINNLVALGVKVVRAITVIGEDGEGYELRQALRKLKVVELARVIVAPDRRTPTYTKPMLCRAGELPRELNRLDIKNRTPLPALLEKWLLDELASAWPIVDALIVVDQVSEEDCGVVTARVRERLTQHQAESPTRFILADSRAHIDRFRSVCLKPNSRECLRASGSNDESPAGIAAAASALAVRANGVVFCTQGEKGTWVAHPEPGRSAAMIAAFPVSGPIDPVGAGDSASAGIACAVAAGASPEEAAAFGNLVASITIQQIGTTGTATPEQIRQRWLDVKSERPA